MKKEEFIDSDEATRIDLLGIQNLMTGRLSKLRQNLIKVQSKMYQSQSWAVANPEKSGRLLQEAITLLDELI